MMQGKLICRGKNQNTEKVLYSEEIKAGTVFDYKCYLDSTVEEVRFCLCGEKGCFIKNIKFSSENQTELEYTTNGVKQGEYYIYAGEEPVFYLKPGGEIKGWIRLTILFYTVSSLDEVIDSNRRMFEYFKERYYYEHNKYLQLSDRVRQITARYININRERKVYKYSTIWKISKPIRDFMDFFKLAKKSISETMGSVRTSGFKETKRKLRQEMRGGLNAKELLVVNLPSEEELRKQKETVFSKKITFSILVPLYNTPKKFLMEMIESVRNQTYGNWELCLADGSDAGHGYVGEICKNYCAKDERIKYRKIEKNMGISGNTNICFEMAAGDYIGLFDHDDLLHPSVLYEDMRVICETGADFIYTDEATFEGEDIDNIHTLHFKPDFAIDNLRANNYICHFSVFDRNLLSKTGLFRHEYDGSQDHDMILRLTMAAKRVEHIPKILYFWRSHSNSVAADIHAKTYAIEAGKRAVKEHLRQCGLEAEVDSSAAFPTIYRIRYKIEGSPKVSIIIPNKDHIRELSQCIDSIRQKSTYKNYEIIIIENNSTEEETFCYYNLIGTYEGIRVIYWDGEFNYSAINNFGVRYAEGDYIVLLNNDTEIISDNWLEEMLMYAGRKDVGAVGVKLYYADNTIQHAGIVLGLGKHRAAGHCHYGANNSTSGYMGRLFYAQDVTAVTGACMMVEKRKYEEAGGLDEEFKVALNDVDFCLKLRKKGYLNIFTPYAIAYHYESKSRGLETEGAKEERFLEEVDRFREKWKEEIEKGDPYFNPNFSLDRPDFYPKEEYHLR